MANVDLDGSDRQTYLVMLIKSHLSNNHGVTDLSLPTSAELCFDMNRFVFPSYALTNWNQPPPASKGVKCRGGGSYKSDIDGTEAMSAPLKMNTNLN